MVPCGGLFTFSLKHAVKHVSRHILLTLLLTAVVFLFILSSVENRSPAVATCSPGFHLRFCVTFQSVARQCQMHVLFEIRQYRLLYSPQQPCSNSFVCFWDTEWHWATHKINSTRVSLKVSLYWTREPVCSCCVHLIHSDRGPGAEGFQCDNVVKWFFFFTEKETSAESFPSRCFV